MSDVKVTVCDESDFQAVLSWLYREMPAATRPDQVAHVSAEINPQNLIVGRQGGKIVGAVVAQPAAGQVAWVWPPSVEPSGDTGRSVAQLLLDAAVARLRATGARLVQALLPPDSEHGPWFTSSGFAHVTDVNRMVWTCDARILDQPTVPGIEFVPYGGATSDALQRVIEASYVGTLDVPELDGVRPIPEVIAGYQSSGEFHAEDWLLAKERGMCVGCVLVNRWPAEQSCELQYMGVVPAARGRGIGRALCTRAMQLACRLNARELWLSVDARNRPGTTLYRSMGFVDSHRRSLFLLRLTPSARPTPR